MALVDAVSVAATGREKPGAKIHAAMSATALRVAGVIRYMRRLGVRK